MIIMMSVCVAVLLGVLEQQVSERTFQAKMERRLAVLVGEGLGHGGGRRWRRATTVGNNSVQVNRELVVFLRVSEKNEIMHGLSGRR